MNIELIKQQGGYKLLRVDEFNQAGDIIDISYEVRASNKGVGKIFLTLAEAQHFFDALADQEPGARSQEPGARSQEPGARSQEPGARSQEE